MELDLSGLCLDMSRALVPVLLYSNFLVLLLWRLCGTSLLQVLHGVGTSFLCN